MSTISKNDDGSFTINPRTAGAESSFLAAGFPADVLDQSSLSGFETGLEITTGGFFSIAVYQTVLACLDTEAAYKAGAITRAEQRQIVMNRVWSSTKNSVPIVLILAATLAVCPWLSGVAAIGGIVGAGFMATRISRAVFDCLTQEQREALKAKAAEVGTQVKGLTDVDTTDEVSAQPA